MKKKSIGGIVSVNMEMTPNWGFPGYLGHTGRVCESVDMNFSISLKRTGKVRGDLHLRLLRSFVSACKAEGFELSENLKLALKGLK